MKIFQAHVKYDNPTEQEIVFKAEDEASAERLLEESIKPHVRDFELLELKCLGDVPEETDALIAPGSASIN